MNLKQAKEHVRKRLRSPNKSRDMLAMRVLLDALEKEELNDDFLRKVIRLCHPDKHDNSDLSNEITSKLNEMRNGR